MMQLQTLSNVTALDNLAARINSEHEACRSAMQQGLEHALEAGRLLLEAKKGLPHGEWLPWLKENCPDIGERTAQNYMRLAREYPKLEPEKAQRVADLSYRDAVRVVSQDLSTIADAGPEEQEIIVATLEAGQSLPQARRAAAKATALPVDHVPSALKPEPHRRRVGILTNGNERKAEVVIGPNQAGLDLKENLQVLRAEEGVEEQDIEAKQRRAKELREEADQLDAEARDDQRDLDELDSLILNDLYGPALHYIETWSYILNDEQWAELQHKQCPEDAAAYISEVGELKERGWWGDMRLQTYSANGPVHSLSIGGNGWNGWGSSEWLGEFFPDGLAPKDIKSGS